jgi:hypothetical protein
MLVGHEVEFEKNNNQIMEYFKCNDIAALNDCAGCKMDRPQQGKSLK